jgi:hypothetical protein
MWIFDRFFPSGFEGMTGKEKTLAILRKYKEVPLYVFLQHWLGASYRTRISELKKEGYNIGILQDKIIRDKYNQKILKREVVYYFNEKPCQTSLNG